MNCLNCNAKLSCGCQKRVATDGKSVCSNCLGLYENKLKTIKNIQPPNPNIKKFR